MAASLLRMTIMIILRCHMDFYTDIVIMLVMNILRLMLAIMLMIIMIFVVMMMLVI